MKHLYTKLCDLNSDNFSRDNINQELDEVCLEEHSNEVIPTGAFKKKHKRKSSVLSCADTEMDSNAQLLNYSDNKITSDASYIKKHKKHKKIKDRNPETNLKDTSQTPKNEIFQSFDFSNFDGHNKNHMKQNYPETATDILTNKTVNKGTNYELCLNASSSASTAKKKHRHTITSNDANIAQSQNYIVSDITEVEYDASYKKRHKNKKHKNDNLINDLRSGDAELIPENLSLRHLNKFVSNSQLTKETKSSNLVTNLGDLNSSINEITDTCKKKHKNYSAVSNYTESVEDTGTAQIYNSYNTELPNEAISDTLHKKKHKKHRYKNTNSTNEFGNEDPSCDSHNISCLDEAISKSNLIKKNKNTNLENRNPDCDSKTILCIDENISNGISIKKHKKHKKHKNTDLENGYSNYDSNSTLYLNEPISDSSRIEKDKNTNSENGNSNCDNHNTLHFNKIISEDNLTKKNKRHKNTYTENEDPDCESQSILCIDKEISNSISVKKHKKHKSTDLENEDTNCNNDNLRLGKLISDGNLMKNHRKHKKCKNTNSENRDSEYDSRNILCPDEPVADDNLMKKSKKQKYENNNLENGDPNYDNNNVCLDELISDGNLKKKHKKHKNYTNANSENRDSTCDSHNILCLNETIFENSLMKKHKKGKKQRNTYSESADSNCDNHSIICLDEPLASDNAIKKHKKTKYKDTNLENGDPNYDTNNILCLNETISKGSLTKKNNKKLKNTDSETIQHSNITAIENYHESELSYNETTDTSCKKKHKKHKKSKDDNKQSTRDEQVFENHSIPYLNQSVFDGHLKKKNKRDKESQLITSENVIAKTVEEVNNVGDEQHLEVSISDSSSKKYRKNNITEMNSSDSNTRIRNPYANISISSIESIIDINKNNDSHVISNTSTLNDEISDENSVASVSLYKTMENKRREEQETTTYILKESLAEPVQHTYEKIYSSSADSDLSFDSTYSLSASNERTDSDLCTRHFNNTPSIENIKESGRIVSETAQELFKINESIQHSNSSYLDFNEDVIDFEVPMLHAKEIIKNLSKNETKELISQGAIIKTGKFTHDEDETILKNFKSFLKQYNMLDISEILGIGKQKKDPNITKFLKVKHFYVRLGKGLNNRTLSSIYRRARRLLHPHKSHEKFQEIEVRNIKYLHNIANRKWIHIADTLQRTEDSCLQAYRWHGKPISRGEWTKEEEDQLIVALKEVTGSSDLSCDTMKGISWDKVATYVPTRNFSQCRMHWAYHLAWKPGSLKKKWNANCNKKLVHILKNEWYVNDASDIDWLKVYESFVDEAPSHIFIQKRWHSLKYLICGSQTFDYKDIIDALCKKYNITPNEIHNTFQS